MKDNQNQPKKAAFSFVSYKVNSITLIEPPPEQDMITIKFDPSGQYYPQNGRYVLNLGFTALVEEKQSTVLSVSLESVFEFEEKNTALADLPTYFYRNSIAIVFPYMRAIISTITSVTNSRPLLLPLLNLSSLEKPLKENTKIFE